MQPDLPTLSIVPLEDLVIHERNDEQRTLPLIKKIRDSKVLRNPPIVIPLKDTTERYMMLDGANRTAALWEMGFPHILVQIVQPDDPGLGLENWNHVVWELDPGRFLKGIHQIPNSDLEPSDDVDQIPPDLWKDCHLAHVKTARQGEYTLCTGSDELVERIDILNRLVDSYRKRARLDRTSLRQIAPLVDIYPKFSGLVIFPPFEVDDLLGLASQGCLLPSGITRFTVSPRALHVNYPLEKLEAQKSLQQKNEELDGWIKEKLAHKRVRYYPESTFLFDE